MSNLSNMENTPIIKVGYLVGGINAGNLAYAVDEDRFNVQTKKSLKEMLILLDKMRGDIHIRLAELDSGGRLTTASPHSDAATKEQVDANR